MRRFFDFIFSFVGICLLLPLILIISVVGMFDTGSALFLQKRVGKNRHPFVLMKFRTMQIDTESVATHLVDKDAVTKFGSFLRKTKLDELPQLFNVLIGDMSLVGARPCLFNQTELIEERDKRGVYNYLPGITGLAQINEIDMSTPIQLAEKDAEMYKTLTIQKYFYYIFATLGGKGIGDRIMY